MKKQKNLKINLGGGNTKIKGSLNLDILHLPNVDIVCDLSKGIPLKENSVSEVVAFHFLEHLEDTIRLMEEIHRVSINGAIVKIKSPYYKSIGAFKDPTHKSFFTENTFDYFNINKRKINGLPEYGFKAEFEIINISYIWSRWWFGIYPLRKLLLPYFWNIARTIYFELKVIK